MSPILALLLSMLSLPMEEIEALLDELTDGDHDDEAAIQAIADLVDEAIDFTVLPVVGDGIEAHDDALVEAIAAWLWRRRGTQEERQERRAARRARRRARRAARQARRAARE